MLLAQAQLRMDNKHGLQLPGFMACGGLTHNNHSLFSEEMTRLRTFKSYPNTACKSAILLAQNGFEYTGNGVGSDDSVSCVCCHATFKNWQQKDDILAIHERLSPHCPMISRRENQNVSMNSRRGFPPHHGETELNHENAMDIGDSSEWRTDSMDSDHSFVDEIDGTSNHSLPSNTETMREDEAPHHSLQFSASHQQTLTQEIIHEHEHLEQSSANASNQQNTTGFDSVDFTSSIAPQPFEVGSIDNGIVQSDGGPTSSPPETAPIPNASEEAPAGTSNSPSWEQLQIYTDLPKRPEYAQKQTREASFESWSKTHHIKVPDLVKSGFYYAGYGDCARCFFCGGGLRNWDPNDNVYVEHARWFPKCAFVRQTMGRKFIDAVQQLHRQDGVEEIALADVLDILGLRPDQFCDGSIDNWIHSYPSVLAVSDIGYNKEDVLTAAKYLVRETELTLSADSLVERLLEQGKWPEDCDNNNFNNISELKGDNKALIKSIFEKEIKQNHELRQQTTCKVCLEKPVSVLFLPCGHLACCSDCAVCFRTCPICRMDVRGVVRAHLA